MTEQRDTFDRVAAEYDAVRPTYPDALFDDLVRVTSLRAGDRVLEVGCGSGQATEGLLRRGLTVTAVDPSANLLALAEQRLTGEVRLHHGTFETFDVERGAHRLVASAQAWHWVDPAVGFAKAADALEAGGWLAVFGHVPLPPAPDMLARMEPVYAELAPALWRPPPQAWYMPQGPLPDLITASGLFGPVLHETYAWTEVVTPAVLLRQLATRSDHNMLPPERREALFAGLRAALQPVDALDQRHETHLYMAQRSTTV